MYSAVVISACYGDTVFRTGQLVLQLDEVGVALQVRIVFGNHQQTAQSSGHFIVGCAGFSNSLCAAKLSTCIRNLLEYLGFMVGVAFNSVYQIRHKVIAALQLVFYLRPFAGYVFVHAYQTVIAAEHQAHADNNGSNDA